MSVNRARDVIRRATGTGTAATVALALLVLGCVFVAIAGPRENLASQTQALRRTFASASPLTASVVATAGWSQFTGDMASDSAAPQQSTFLTGSQIGEVTDELRGGLAGDGVPLAPAATGWFGMTAATTPVVSGAAEDAAHLGGTDAKLEVVYREPLTRYAALVSGQYPGSGGGGTALQVAVTEQTAARLGLHPGSKLVIGPGAGGVTLGVTGIIRQRLPGSSFWTADPAIAAPAVQHSARQPPFWMIGVFAGADETGQFQRVFGVPGITLQWQFPVSLGEVSASQARALYSRLKRATAQAPPLLGDVASASAALGITTGMLTPLAAFIATQAAISDVAWLLFASLTVIAAAVLLLASRMLTVHRAAELTLLRARGASVRQIAALALRGCALACLPAAAAGAALAIAVVPDGSVPAAWWLGGITVLTALAAPAAVAAWRHRLRLRPAGTRRARLRRLVAEATLCAAAIAGIIVFRQQAATAAGGINLYTATAPVLVAIPAVVVIARLYPLVLRAMLRLLGRRAGVTGFVGLARAARTSLTPTLPAFALVLALTLAAFAGMVRDAITRGEVAASWQAAGADALIDTGGSGPVITPAARRAIAAVPGVRRTATAWITAWTLPDNQQVTVVAVDPASYAALVATTQTWPQVPAAKLAPPAGTPAQPVPVLASPAVATSLAGSGTVTTQGGLRPLLVRVAGVLSGTPAVPGNTSFFIAPITAIRGEAGPWPLNLLLVTGSGIGASALTAAVQRALPGSLTTITIRSAILNALTGAPLQHGTYVIFALAIAAAAGLGLVVMVLELALGSGDRELTLARLATMGLTSRQRIRLTLLEVLPALLAAAVAATGCALALPPLLAPVLNLSVFTGSGTPVRVLPDFTSFTLPLAGLALLAATALAIEIRAQQRRGVAAQLRGGG
ncbi:MAG: hypothetical protein JOY82_21630 [Streptosporangiaceae bacterium]|nr:hypothetical protein [Streptosporangiaceae bacterium]MBV9857085.1 hypothetical protein [Streptosporangiaceae bacterium]